MSGRPGVSVPVAATAGAAAAVYAGLWVGYLRGWTPLTAGDDAVLLAAHDLGSGHPVWTSAWTVISAALGPTSMRVLAAVGIGVALARRNLRTALFLAVTVLGMGMVTAAAKALVDRPRPATALVAAASSSFPSGHALGIMAATLAFLAVLAPLLPAPARVWAVVAGAAAILLGGVARVVLNVHHPSDVLAGWALGYLWFLVCVTIVPPDRSRRDRRCGTR